MDARKKLRELAAKCRADASETREAANTMDRHACKLEMYAEHCTDEGLIEIVKSIEAQMPEAFPS